MPSRANPPQGKAAGQAQRDFDDDLAEMGITTGSGVTTGRSVAIGGEDTPRTSTATRGATGGKAAKPRARRTSRLSVQHGSASMKAYPVTSYELWGLGGVGLLASLAFSTAAALVSFSIDTEKDLALSIGAAKDVIAYWDATGTHAFRTGIGLFVIGIALVAGGSLYIKHILNRTTFDD